LTIKNQQSSKLNQQINLPNITTVENASLIGGSQSPKKLRKSQQRNVVMA
jgi:hypothetical protein